MVGVGRPLLPEIFSQPTPSVNVIIANCLECNTRISTSYGIERKTGAMLRRELATRNE